VPNSKELIAFITSDFLSTIKMRIPSQILSLKSLKIFLICAYGEIRTEERKVKIFTFDIFFTQTNVNSMDFNSFRITWKYEFKFKMIEKKTFSFCTPLDPSGLNIQIGSPVTVIQKKKSSADGKGRKFVKKILIVTISPAWHQSNADTGCRKRKRSLSWSFKPLVNEDNLRKVKAPIQIRPIIWWSINL